MVDVLADRSAETTAKWLVRRPGVEIVSRDRCGLYAQGARSGALQARQVTDRFHLLQNLRERIEQQLSRVYRGTSAAAEAQASPVVIAAAAHDSHGRQPELAKHLLLERRGRRAVWLDRFERVKTLQREGKSLRLIADETGLNWRTIAKWTSVEALPERRTMAPKPTTPIKFEAYLARRWAEGVRCARHLLSEIRDRGYLGSLTHLNRLLSKWRRAGHGPAPNESDANDAADWTGMGRDLPPWAASFLCMNPRRQLTEREAENVAKLSSAAPGFMTMRKLAMRFRGILKGRNPGKLDAWLEDACRVAINDRTLN